MFNNLSSWLKGRARGWLGLNDYTRGFSTWDGQQMSPLTFQSTAARLQRYRIYESYYQNRIYYNRADMAMLQLNRPKLYKHLRGVYNPVGRLVDFYVSKVYGGMLDLDSLDSGAMPIDGADDRLKLAIQTLWYDSNMQKVKQVFVRSGATYGDALWKICDEPQNQIVRMEPLDPRKVVELKMDPSGAITFIRIEYMRTDEATGRDFVYAEEIDESAFRTYYNDQPHAFYTDAAGQQVAQWENEYGFVPVAAAQHVATDGIWGRTSFANCLDKINEINDEQSALNDQIRKVIAPIWAITGVGVIGELSLGNGDRDSIAALPIPEGGGISPFVFPLDIAGTVNNIDRMLMELERDMPELALHRLRENGQLTAPGVKAGYSDAIDRVAEVQGNYDACTVQAHQMAISIGGFRGYEGYSGYSLDSRTNGDLMHSIKERPVVQDQLSKSDKVNALKGTFDELMLKEMDYDEDAIAEALNRKDDQTRSAMAGIADAAFGQQGTQDQTDPSGAENNPTDTGIQDNPEDV